MGRGTGSGERMALRAALPEELPGLFHCDDLLVRVRIVRPGELLGPPGTRIQSGLAHVELYDETGVVLEAGDILARFTASDLTASTHPFGAWGPYELDAETCERIRAYVSTTLASEEAV